MDITINYLAVFIASIVTMVLGVAWYSHSLFGKAWMKGMGMTQEKMEKLQKETPKGMYFLAFIGSFVMAFVLAHFVQAWNVQDTSGALALAFWVWLGFIATTMINSILWEGKSFKFYLINTSYQLVSLASMALILTYLK